MNLDFASLAPIFVTFFVVIDPIGVAPIFAGLTRGAPGRYRRMMAIKSVLIAAIVLLGFAYGGEWLLSALHVSFDAFRAAGGVLLFLLALDMIFERRAQRREERAERVSEEAAAHPERLEDISVFPMAIPMIAGPGAIASVMLFMAQAKTDLAAQSAVLIGMGANLALCLGLFLAVGPLMRLIGETLAAMITRILGVILAALAAQFVFDGIAGAFGLGM